MKRLAKISAILWIALGWIVLGAAVLVAAEPIASLRPSNYVNDFAGVLDAATQARLNDLCHEVEQKAQAQIAVVTVKSTDGEDVFQLCSGSVSEVGDWEEREAIGSADPAGNAGSQVRSKCRLWSGTDSSGWEDRWFRREVVPYLRSGDYAAGLTLMTSEIADVIAQDAGVTLRHAASSGCDSPATFAWRWSRARWL